MYISRPTETLNAWVLLPVRGYIVMGRILTGGTQRFFVRSYNLEIGLGGIEDEVQHDEFLLDFGGSDHSRRRCE